jgi:hypothetical protein
VKDRLPRSATGSNASAIRGCARTSSPRRGAIDVAEPHVYAVDWRRDGVDFLLDGERLRTVAQAPSYPMQLIIGVFDFPSRPAPEGGEPELILRRVRGR